VHGCFSTHIQLGLASAIGPMFQQSLFQPLQIGGTDDVDVDPGHRVETVPPRLLLHGGSTP